MSCSVPKHALPITRFSISRPATATSIAAGSSFALSSSACRACRSAASAVRRKSFGNACPCARSAASFCRRSAMMAFSSGGGVAPGAAVSFMA